MTRLAALCLAALTPVAAAAQDDPAFGHWMVESGEAIVEISPCGGSACGRIVWLANPVSDEDGGPVRDRGNKDETLRDRPICGLEMLGGFEREAPGEWRDGEIYDAASGDTYTANMEIRDDGRLHVRGYVGLPILGRSQDWTRVDGDRGGC